MDLNGISSYLKCPLCKKLFENPKHLPCGHNICESCLQCHIIQTVRMVGYDIFDFLDGQTPDLRPSETCFKCPIDKKEVTPKNPAQNVNKWANQFENNLNIVTLLEICYGIQRGVIEYCDSCIEVSQKVTASSVCLSCVEKYCVKCSFIHRYTHSKDLLLNLSAIQSLLPNNVTANSSSETCKIHIFCHMSLFCDNCKEICCTSCRKTVHKNCKHVPQLKNESWESGTSDHLEQLAIRIKTVSSQIAIIIEDDMELFDRAKSLIDTSNTALYRTFEYRLNELKCQIKRWGLHQEQTQQSLKYLNEMNHKSSGVKPSKRIQTEMLCLEMEKAIAYREKRTIDKHKKLKIFRDALDEDRKNNRKDNISLPNRRNKNLTTRIGTDKFNLFVNIDNGDKLVDISSKVQIVDKINVETDNDENVCWLTDCLFLTSEFFIVVDKLNESIKWKQKNGQVKSLSLQSSPQCLATDKVGKTGCVTLPDNKAIQFFCIKDYSINLTHQFETKERCYGVDYINLWWIVVSCQRCPESSVCILNENGAEIRRFSRSELNPYGISICDPRYLKVQINGDEIKMFVTDFKLQTVSCITLLESEGHFSTKDMCYHAMRSTPRGIDNDESGNIIVCSNSAGNVQKIMCTKENEQQHLVLTKDLWLPRAVSFLKGGNMFIVTSDTGPLKNHVLVYEITSKAC